MGHPDDTRAVDRLDADAIREGLSTRAVGSRVVVFESTASTNAVAAEYARSPGHHGLVVVAEVQTAGRGRRGNRWLSGKGESLLCSVVLTQCALRAELLSLTAAVASAQAIGPQARIKWPNDILLSGRKVAGILTESKALEGRTAYVIGIGINCHQGREDFPPELRATATSLDLATGTVVDRNRLARQLLVCLDHWLTVAGQDPAQVVDAWKQLSVHAGHRLTLVHDGKRYSGTCIGVEPDHGLILQLDRGAVRMFDAAHSHIDPLEDRAAGLQPHKAGLKRSMTTPRQSQMQRTRGGEVPRTDGRLSDADQTQGPIDKEKPCEDAPF